jgi:hypothetical protein
MTSRILRSLPVVALLLHGCAGAPAAPCADTQRIVESIAAKHPECVRLTVHAVPPAGGGHVAVASTSATKLGKPSDAEDLEAMQTGKPVLLDEPGALDVTVPMLWQDHVWTAACGVTLQATAGASRADLQTRAEAIAKEVETAMAVQASQPAPPAQNGKAQ